MRFILFIFLLALAAGCGTTKKTALKTINLDGTWAPTRLEIDGKDLPASSFEKQRLIISDSNYTYIAESTDKGVVRRSENKMDLYGRDGVNAGKHFTAIYKYENELLTICYNLAGDSYPETFETKSKPMFFIAVFKKEKSN